ncbi:IS200/IS605 family transposase [bacterium]|nr:IS200/IS605 family transposase [bacterium]
MANTYTQIYIQFVFAVQNRISLIRPEWKDELYKYITGIIKKQKHKLIAINGTVNHLHVFIGYKPHQSIPDLLQDIKGHSSKWINERGFAMGKFSWQAGYGAFSYSQSQIDPVVKYIVNQEKHHKRKTFREEYIQFLKTFQIQFDEKYILNDIGDLY